LKLYKTTYQDLQKLLTNDLAICKSQDCQYHFDINYKLEDIYLMIYEFYKIYDDNKISCAEEEQDCLQTLVTELITCKGRFIRRYLFIIGEVPSGKASLVNSLAGGIIDDTTDGTTDDIIDESTLPMNSIFPVGYAKTSHASINSLKRKTYYVMGKPNDGDWDYYIPALKEFNDILPEKRIKLLESKFKELLGDCRASKYYNYNINYFDPDQLFENRHKVNQSSLIKRKHFRNNNKRKHLKNNHKSKHGRNNHNNYKRRL
jgi:hypothetical protein